MTMLSEKENQQTIGGAKTAISGALFTGIANIIDAVTGMISGITTSVLEIKHINSAISGEIKAANGNGFK